MRAAPTRSPSSLDLVAVVDLGAEGRGHAVDRDAALLDQLSASRRDHAPLSLEILVEPHRGRPYLSRATHGYALRILLLTPPMTQLNTPYPATAYLTGFLRQHAERARPRGRAGRPGDRAVPAAVLARRARSGRATSSRRAVAGRATTSRRRRSRTSSRTRDALRRHRRRGRAVPAGPRPGARAAHRRPRRSCPRARGSRAIDEAGATTTIRSRWAFGALGVADRAQAPREPVHRRPRRRRSATASSRDFELSRYGEQLAASAPTFDPLRDALEGEPTLVDDAARRARRASCSRAHAPDVVGLTVPFPGNVYGAFRIARAIKARRTGDAHRARRRLRQHRAARARRAARVRLRRLRHARRRRAPLLALLEHLRDPTQAAAPHVRPRRRRGRARAPTPTLHDIPLRDAGTPTYDGLPLDRYLSLFEMLNPMHRLWSDGRWNKLTIAHGCYWKKCTFCDVTLDYIARYDRAPRRPARRSDRGARRRDRPDRLSLRRRGGAAGRRCARSPSG